MFANYAVTLQSGNLREGRGFQASYCDVFAEVTDTFFGKVQQRSLSLRYLFPPAHRSPALAHHASISSTSV